MRNITIAIDGYSSTGKSTIAKQLAKELSYVYTFCFISLAHFVDSFEQNKYRESAKLCQMISYENPPDCKLRNCKLFRIANPRKYRSKACTVIYCYWQLSFVSDMLLIIDMKYKNLDQDLYVLDFQDRLGLVNPWNKIQTYAVEGILIQMFVSIAPKK